MPQKGKKRKERAKYTLSGRVSKKYKKYRTRVPYKRWFLCSRPSAITSTIPPARRSNITPVSVLYWYCYCNGTSKQEATKQASSSTLVRRTSYNTESNRPNPTQLTQLNSTLLHPSNTTNTRIKSIMLANTIRR